MGKRSGLATNTKKKTIDSDLTQGTQIEDFITN